MSNRDVVKEIRKATRRKFSAEDKIRVVLEGLRGEVPVSEVCRVEGIAPTMYYRCMYQKTAEPGEVAPDDGVCLSRAGRLGRAGISGIGGAAKHTPV